MKPKTENTIFTLACTHAILPVQGYTSFLSGILTTMLSFYPARSLITQIYSVKVMNILASTVVFLKSALLNQNMN
ncbi:MAG: hypothetical protein V7K57_08380 [Nostoc sp.]|uniref:hypothetical protein n=1 Tax=Nostoc sp. TaxID=1180 RepID=UPI002FFAABFD